MIEQPSNLLKQYNIPHMIGGISYNFKQGQGELMYRENVERLLKEGAMKFKRLVHAEQVHGNHVAMIDGEEDDYPLFAGYSISPQTDGLMTNQEETALLIRMADCTPIVIYDPVHHAIAVVHSGWKSTVQEIGRITIEKMQSTYQSKKEDLVVYLGPSIDQDNYEVGQEVYDAFEKIGQRPNYFKPNGEKYLLDMIQSNIQVLKNIGIKSGQIEYSTESTFESDKLHSARKEGTNYRLNAILVKLPKKEV